MARWHGRCWDPASLTLSYHVMRRAVSCVWQLVLASSWNAGHAPLLLAFVAGALFRPLRPTALRPRKRHQLPPRHQQRMMMRSLNVSSSPKIVSTVV